MKVGQPEYKQAIEHILWRLRDGLAPNLYYHGYAHTANYVMPAAAQLADGMGLDTETRNLLLTAAAYHDSGFLEQYEQNEEIGRRMAEEALPQFGFTAEQIHTIVGIIMATQLPQEPNSVAQQVMCDADLDTLGREDFFVTSHQLRLERAAYGDLVPVREWYEQQLAFLEEHDYFTAAARALRGEQKARNLEEVRLLLRANGSR